MARLRFALGTRYLLRGAVYLVRQVLVDARIVVENQTSGEQAAVAVPDLIAAWATGALTFEGPCDGVRSLPNAPTVVDLQGVTPAQRDEAWRRYTLIQPLLALPSAERTRRVLDAYAAARAGGDTSISRASLQRWLHAFNAGGGDIRALVPATSRVGARGEGRLPADVEAIVGDVLAACAAAPRYRTGLDVYLLVLNGVAECVRHTKSRPK